MLRAFELRSSARGGELMHLKGYCVDHRLLRTGSANFSRSVGAALLFVSVAGAVILGLFALLARGPAVVVRMTT